jgi:hypothetical protein
VQSHAPASAALSFLALNGREDGHCVDHRASDLRSEATFVAGGARHAAWYVPSVKVQLHIGKGEQVTQQEEADNVSSDNRHRTPPESTVNPADQSEDAA